MDLRQIAAAFNAIDAEGREIAEPDTDVLEMEDAYLVLCDLPGMEPDDIVLELREQGVSLKAEARLDLPAGLAVEALEFSRTIYRLDLSLPARVDVSALEASYKDGVLTMKLPKKTETIGTRIKVQSA